MNYFKVCLLVLWTFSGCSVIQKYQASQARSQAIATQVFLAPYDQLWQAIQACLPYPLAATFMEEGYIETEWIPADEGFRRWDVVLDNPHRYRIKVTLTKLSDHPPQIRVSVEKEVETLPGFFKSSQPVSSDGFEERWILYRIGRELKIQSLIQRSSRSVHDH